jgi:hypothetical protein
MWPGRGRDSPDGEDGRGLAGVAAEQADHPPSYRERDPVQDVAVTVIGVDVLNVQHQCAIPR